MMINEQIIHCTKCKLHIVEYNDNSQRDRGYGKLMSKEGEKSNDIMVIGLNPSRNRWPGLRCAFNADSYDERDKSGWFITYILKQLDVYHDCFFTNIVKCSTSNNKITAKDIDNCFEHLENEIEYCKPKIILAAGTQVYDYLMSKGIKNVRKIYHPSYCLAYKRISVEDYVEHIREVLFGSTYIFNWANNDKRKALKNRECKVVSYGKKNSVLVEFLDNKQREVVSRNSLKKK